MARAKWFPKLKTTTPLSAAAQRVLASRVRAVQYYLNPVTTRPFNDPEHLHQLRVATRRLAAAVSIFRGCLGGHSRRRLRRAARRLRRAAGAVRDLDVLSGLLEEQLTTIGERPASAAGPCRAEFERLKSAAERELAVVVREGAVQFKEAVAAAMTSLKQNGIQRTPDETLGSVARSVSRKLLRQLRWAGRQDLRDLDNLHKLRIAAKRLRYAMEVFATCYPAGLRRQLYPRVELLQSELGKINDLRILCQTLPRIRSTAGVRRHREAVALVDEAGAAVGKELAARQAEFLARWWAEHCGFEQSFKRMLASARRGAGGRPERFRIHQGPGAHKLGGSKL